jgi:hypothetical protein
MSAAPDAAGDPPAACEAASDAAGWEAAAVDADGDGVAPLEQAEATIATIASGAATRRNACLVVKLLSPQVDRLCLDNVDFTAWQATDAIRCPPLAIARLRDGDPLLGSHTRSRAFDCRADGASRV